MTGFRSGSEGEKDKSMVGNTRTCAFKRVRMSCSEAPKAICGQQRRNTRRGCWVLTEKAESTARIDLHSV